MKKLLLLALTVLYISVNAQKHNLVYKEYQDYDTINYTYTPSQSVIMPCEIDFTDSIVIVGDKQGNHAKFKLETFNIANDRIIYQCKNEELNKPCAVVLYVYGDYRYMEVIYSTTNKFKYRVKVDEALSLNKK